VRFPRSLPDTLVEGYNRSGFELSRLKVADGCGHNCQMGASCLNTCQTISVGGAVKLDSRCYMVQQKFEIALDESVFEELTEDLNGTLR
jgi:hypothetical protein